MKTTEYFSGLASAYDAHRPSYPIEAIDATLAGLSSPATVADVGCGTGISSRLLASRGARVIGIDPNADMLATARAVTGEAGLEIEFRLGPGEATGLPQASLDLVLCAQAFHWLRPMEALREFHRILKPAPPGRLALMWNVRDNGHDEFTRAYSEIARRSMANARQRGMETHDLRSADPTQGGFFRNATTQTFANPHRLTLDGLLGRARSASYFPRPGDPLREILEIELRALFEQHQRDGKVTLMHRTEVTTALRAK